MVTCICTWGLTLGLMGCAGSGTNETTGSGNSTTGVVETQSGAETTSPEKNSDQVQEGESLVSEAANKKLEELTGEWILEAVIYEDYVDFGNEQGFDGYVDIYMEDGKYKLDNVESMYESSLEWYGCPLVEGKGEMFRKRFNTDQYFSVSRKRDTINTYGIAMQQDGSMIMQNHYEYTYEDEETGEKEEYADDSYKLYLRDGDPNRTEILNRYRYQETVTVSTVEELYNALGSGKHIILKGGTYNISKMDKSKVSNDNLNYYYYEGEYHESYGDSIVVNYLSNVWLEGEAGAEVLICTEDYSVAPLEFQSCGNIVLENLTLGHEVEPGYCSGAVVSMESSYYVTVKNCRLYGSGTYGIEARYCNSVEVTDSQIYECTYGLLELGNCSNWTFTDCQFRDSMEFSMLDMAGCW